MIHCKYCGSENNNGTNFCTRKCRILWKRKHEIKGAKKKFTKNKEFLMMQYGSDFNNEIN